MSYSIQELKLIKKLACLAEHDLRSDLDGDRELSSVGATYLSDAFREVTRLKNATQKLIEEREKA